MLQLPALYVGVHEKSPLHAELTGDVQKFLLGRGYPIRVDENFGPKTAESVRGYQIKKHISVDGRIGPQTWGMLLADGFRPQSFEPEREGYGEVSPHWPPKPAGMRSPNGLVLFGGKDFTYKASPVPKNPERIIINTDWVSKNITMVEIPQLSKLGVSRISFNSQLAPQLRLLFDIWEAQGMIGRILTYSGAWVARFVRGRTDKLSNHAFGSAFDINAMWNGFRSMPALVGEIGCVRELVPAAFEAGFYWGGWYNDGMHFEAYKVLTAAELQDVRERLVTK